MVHFTRACKTLLSENNKTRLTFEKQQEKNKNIICRPWSVRIEKNCALGLEHGPRPAASGRIQDLWHSFSQYGPPGRQIIYMYPGWDASPSQGYPLCTVQIEASTYPRAYPGHLTVILARRWGNLNVALKGWGI